MEQNLEQSEADSNADNQDERVTPDPAESKQDSKNPAPEGAVQSKNHFFDNHFPGILGKFATVDALVKAYEELQTAFTKKSQELADTKNNNASVAQKKEVEKQTQVLDAKPSEKTKSSDEVIKEYLLSVMAGKTAPTVIAGSGNGLAFSNVTEARTIHATTKVAENFFKEKKI